MEEQSSGRIVIGMDPHKRSVTIEAMGPQEAILGRGRFDTDQVGLLRKRSTGWSADESAQFVGRVAVTAAVSGQAQRGALPGNE